MADQEEHINNRNANEGSTSRYIQQKLPNPKGERKVQVSQIDEMPEQNIIDRLITIVQTLFTFTRETEINAVENLTKVEETLTIQESSPTSELGAYGEVQVQETSSGHVIIVDDTPGNERLVTQHANGTYDAMTSKGDRTHKTMRDQYTFVQRDMIVHVKRNHVTITNGNCTVEISADEIKNIAGFKKTNIGEDRETNIEKSDSKQVGGNQSELVAGDIGSKTLGDRTEVTDGNKSDGVQGNLDTFVGGNHNSTIDGNLVEKIKGGHTSEVASLKIISTGPVEITSASQVTITAPSVSLN